MNEKIQKLKKELLIIKTFKMKPNVLDEFLKVSVKSFGANNFTLSSKKTIYKFSNQVQQL